MGYSGDPPHVKLITLYKERCRTVVHYHYDKLIRNVPLTGIAIGLRFGSIHPKIHMGLHTYPNPA